MSKKPKVTAQVTPPQPDGSGIRLEDFVAYLPIHNFIFMPCRELWVSRSINAVLPKMPVLDKRGRPKFDKKGNPVMITASTWLSQNRRVIQMAWVPGEPVEIKDRMVVDGGWIGRKDVTCFNLYRPPRRSLATPTPQGYGLNTSTSCSFPARPITSSGGWRIACSIPESRSITPWCWAARLASARTVCSSR